MTFLIKPFVRTSLREKTKITRPHSEMANRCFRPREIRESVFSLSYVQIEFFSATLPLIIVEQAIKNKKTKRLLTPARHTGLAVHIKRSCFPAGVYN